MYKYETPIFEEVNGLDYLEQIWSEFCQGKWCFGCTNCNCN